ncbi:hypothetical protein COV20_02165 [Candidatus Woesearchaeota archaeon CG10_big_fil_rev_8_21_14_0_10_45_16]|nr:MAG: hypothetical protein COV20_02165 [Candidatus Woesearchaeota archaeon CG10_big_fil_rev_8_21_14_0_10_45_16]
MRPRQCRAYLITILLLLLPFTVADGSAPSEYCHSSSDCEPNHYCSGPQGSFVMTKCCPIDSRYDFTADRCVSQNVVPQAAAVVQDSDTRDQVIVGQAVQQIEEDEEEDQKDFSWGMFDQGLSLAAIGGVSIFGAAAAAPAVAVGLVIVGVTAFVAGVVKVVGALTTSEGSELQEDVDLAADAVQNPFSLGVYTVKTYQDQPQEEVREAVDGTNGIINTFLKLFNFQ